VPRPINDTIRKFGYPGTLLAEYGHWVVLLRPKQLTCGSMVLACKEDALALGAVSGDAWAGLARATAELEAASLAAFAHDRINYLALMMFDPHVHFHVLPRYESSREVGGVTFVDSAWPKPPDVTQALELTDEQLAAVGDALRSAWPTA
jgi:diadenosine tetraphosphate (Ap4A) HIT family hydrolase